MLKHNLQVSGCVVFLVDESAAMNARVAGGTKSKAQSIATALNSLLAQLTAGPPLDVAVVGYRAAAGGEGDAEAEGDVGPRWRGPLAGRQFVATSELAASPWEIESRVRKVPGSGGVGNARSETVPFPVWYAPAEEAATDPPVRSSLAAAWEHCRRMLSDWLAATPSALKPPMVVSFVGELAGEDPPEALGQSLREMETPGGPPLVVYAHLSSSDRIPAISYPSSDAHLPPGPVRLLFRASSVLPDAFCGSLREFNLAVNAGARGLIYNARMVDVIRLLSLVKTYATYTPPAPAGAALPAAAAAQAAEAPAGAAVSAAVETRALVVLLLDRSAENPAEEKTAWHRLQQHANELLGQISKRASGQGGGQIDCAVVSYGTGAAGEPEVQTTFAGPLAGRSLVPDGDLAEGALRVEESTEQVSNGIGGLVSVTRKRPVFVDLKPTAAQSPSPGLEAVSGLLAEWRQDHPDSQFVAVVLHATRGRFDPEEAARAVDRLRETAPVTLYHLIITESPHPSVAYPAEADRIEDPTLAKLWELTSPLLGSEALAAKKATVSPQSRGMVINGKFDLFLDGIQEAHAFRLPRFPNG
jgi:hypothetical protein